jgi:hypothetical protein
MTGCALGHLQQLLLFRTLPADRGSRSLARVDGKARHGGYAHLPGGGPAGACCGSCRYFGTTAHQSKQFAFCRLAYHQWSQDGLSGDPVRARAQARRLEKRLGAIEASTSSCKFFEVRE